MLKIICLGTGSAFTLSGEGEEQNYQSNFLIESPSGKRLLIDAGGDIRFALKECGIQLGSIDDIYISHLHADHIGGLEYIGFSTYFNPTLKRPNLHLSSSLVEPLWESLRAGMRSLQGLNATLDTYFNVNPIKNNSWFIWEGVKFKLVQTIHVVDEFAFMPSYGLIFEINDRTVFLTTDTQFCPHQIKDFYKFADIILHDCETSPFKSGVHANYADMKTLPDEVKAKMWLYHYQPGKLPNAEEDGFLGFLKRGQVIEL